MLTRLVSYRKATAGRGLLAAFLVVTMSGPPLEVPSQDEGSPVFVIESYATTPSPVRSGQSFALTVTLKNTGTKHADDIFATVGSGSSFVGIGAPAPVGKLDPGMSASFTLQVQAPDKLSSGAADLPLHFLYRIGDSPAQEVVRSVGIRVSGSSGVTGRPQIVIENAEVISPPGAAGDAFELLLTLRNVGARRADDVTASLHLNDSVSPAAGSGTTRLGDLGVNQAATFSLAMILDKASPTGRVLQTIALEYSDADGQGYASEETVGLDLGTAGRKRPQLIVAGYASDPARPAPGEQFALTVRVANVGAGDARRLLLRLGDETGLHPFGPLGTSNVSFVSSLGAGETTIITQTLLVDGAAEGGTYPIQVSLAYENVAGEAQTEAEVITLLVLIQPKLQVNLFEPMVEPLRAGEAFEIPVEVVNIGRHRINVSTVEVVSRDLTLTEAGLYLGPLDAGTSGSLVPLATADQAGPARAQVIVHYLDDFNQEQTYTHNLRFTIESAAAPAAPNEAQAEPTFLEKVWRAILGFFGLGG